jgi:hypothetical protein
MVRRRPPFPKKMLRQKTKTPAEEADGRRRLQIILKKTPPKKTPFSKRLVYPITGLALRERNPAGGV